MFPCSTFSSMLAVIKRAFDFCQSGRSEMIARSEFGINFPNY